ncbi:hypothetical protein PIROE2DRAFT_15766 [Piromyces sp. E2]|nr:hypothetical protein PIROE2DRAFT_15766 [Piromyces sp. E2]|eukprot:OUM58866.1 hypothetical protein PIROE2DRAFT_15766 [Piromyces sp. E2]
MERNLKIEINKTNRGKKQIIVYRKYKFNFSNTKKNNSKIFRCTEYKTLNKYKSFIILNDKKEILKYESSHNHPEKEFEVSISLTKHKLKDEIRKSSNPFDIKVKPIFNKISKEIGFVCPEYSTIKSQIKRNINKYLSSKIKKLDEIPNESIYYKTERNENFMIFKNPNLIIFQSPF